MSRRAVFYIVAYNTFTIITKFKVLGEKNRKMDLKRKATVEGSRNKKAK